MAIQLLSLRDVLLFILFLAAVLPGGAFTNEINSRVRRDLWKDDPYDDGSFSELIRSQRQITSSTIDPTIPPSLTSTTDGTSTPPPFGSSTPTSPPFGSSTPTSPPFDPSTPPPPDTTPDPNDKCGTSFSAISGRRDPRPCSTPTSNCSNSICMLDFSSNDLYSCVWSSRINTFVKRSLPTNSTPTRAPPPLVVEVPGNCQPNNTPPEFTNSSRIPHPLCVLHRNSSTFSGNATKCVCTKWDGSCPEEEIEYCEKEQLLSLATEQIRKVMQISEMVQPGCPCNYELEQKLPLAIQAVEDEKNLYRANMLLFQAKKTHICNRRRFMTCQPDGTCGCAPGTARREFQGKGFKILSYYCYPTQGNCDDDPINVMKQFQPAADRVRRHYGDPNESTHKDYGSGCFFNYCKNAAQQVQSGSSGIRTCSN